MYKKYRIVFCHFRSWPEGEQKKYFFQMLVSMMIFSYCFPQSYLRHLTNPYEWKIYIFRLIILDISLKCFFFSFCPHKTLKTACGWATKLCYSIELTCKLEKKNQYFVSHFRLSSDTHKLFRIYRIDFEILLNKCIIIVFLPLKYPKILLRFFFPDFVPTRSQ